MPSASRGISLQEALEVTYAQSPTLRADRAGLRMLDEELANARAGSRPTISGEASILRSEIDVVGTGGIVGGRINQPLFRGGRVINNIRAARANVAAGREALRITENDLFLDAIRAYAGVVRDREVLALNRKLIDIFEAQRAAEQRRLDAGERTRTDVSQAEGRRSAAVANSALADRRLASSRETFRAIVGVEPVSLQPLPPAPRLPATKEEAIAIAVNESPQVQRAIFGEQVARYQVKVAQGARLPSLDASASTSWRDEVVQILNREVNQTLATFQMILSVPLYQGGAEFAQIRRAQHLANLRRLEVEETIREVSAQAATAWDQLRTAQAAILAGEAAVRSNEAAVAGVRREAGGGGSRTTIDVLDAERDLSDSRTALVLARYDAYIAAYELLAAMGRLTARNLDLSVDLYDPDRPNPQLVEKGTGTLAQR